VIQLPSDENTYIFNDSGESGNELKSEWKKKKTQLYLVLWAEGTCDLSQTSLLVGPRQRIDLHQMAHYTKENLDSNTLSQLLPKLSNKEG
jgi:hypothetical protein